MNIADRYFLSFHNAINKEMIKKNYKSMTRKRYYEIVENILRHISATEQIELPQLNEIIKEQIALKR